MRHSLCAILYAPFSMLFLSLIVPPAQAVDPCFLFLTRDGKPRVEIAYSVKKLSVEYVGIGPSPHSFRHMQVCTAFD